MFRKLLLPLVINLALAALAVWLFIGSIGEEHLPTELRTLSAPVRPFMPSMSSSRSTLRLLIFGVGALAVGNIFKLLKAYFTGRSDS